MQMIGEHLNKLVSVGSDPLIRTPADFVAADSLGRELADLLTVRNGFYAFESALRVFPVDPSGRVGSLGDWNEPTTWRDAYGGMADGFTFFAEDVFGGQFGIHEGSVFAFDPETGEAKVMATSLDSWAKLILGDYQVLTGHPIAHDWQMRFGRIPEGQRLVPKIPFVLGGEFGVDNVFALEATKGMRLRGELAVQIRDLPNGTKISYRFT
jgi:hypothetical protein